MIPGHVIEPRIKITGRNYAVPFEKQQPPCRDDRARITARLQLNDRISRQDEANAGPDDRSAGGLRDVHGTDGRLHPPAGEELRGRTGLSGW